MKKKETTKKIYDTPKVEVVKFSFEDSIAASGMGVSYFEQIWGGGN